MNPRKLLGSGLGVGLLSLGLALGLPVSAQDITWKFEDEKVRYDLSLGDPEPATPTSAPKTRPFRLIGESDFSAGRPSMEIADPGDLIWYYALSTPRGAWPKKKRSPLIEEVSDRFALKGQGALVIKGNHSARRRGKRATVRSSLLISNPDKDDYWLKKGVLTITRTFDLKAGRLESAQFNYEITVRKDDASKQHVWEGWIRTEAPARPKKGADDGGAIVRFDRPAFHGRVQAAIAKGAKWLEGQADTRLTTYKSKPPARHAVGHLALPCFALLRSGVPPANLAAHVDWLKSQPFEATYDVSLLIMVLEALSVERKVIAPRAHTRSVARFKRGKVPQGNKAIMARATKWLIETRKKGEGWWSYFGRPGKGPLGHDMKSPGGGDRSNSQFAVLALHSAFASGVKVSGEVWKEILDESLKSQRPKGPRVSLEGSALNKRSPLRNDPRDREIKPGGTMTRGKDYSSLGGERLTAQARGWDYSMKRPPAKDGAYGSMSAAGVSTLATAREGLRETGRLTGKQREEAETALRDGLGWLLDNYDVTRNPNKGSHYYYYAYSVEKAMDTAGVERLANKEWWRDFAVELLARQDDNGSWEGNVERTSFALLVLNRATLPVQLDIGEIERRATGEGDPSMWDVVIVPETGQLSVRQLLDAMLTDPAEAPARLPLARKALAGLPDHHRPRVVPELTALLDHPHRKTGRWARESLRLLAGTDEPAALARFSASWEVLRVAGDGLDYGLIEPVRDMLTKPQATVPLKLHAMRALGRLGAVEAIPDLIAALTAGDQALREGAWDYLVSLAGGEHAAYSPAGNERARAEAQKAWRGWWSKSGPARVTQEHVRREIGNLAFPPRAKGASKRLEAIGKPALRGLVDGLRSDATREPAHDLLLKISGQVFPAKVDPWLEWLETQGD